MAAGAVVASVKRASYRPCRVPDRPVLVPVTVLLPEPFATMLRLMAEYFRLMGHGMERSLTAADLGRDVLMDRLRDWFSRAGIRDSARPRNVGDFYRELLSGVEFEWVPVLDAESKLAGYALQRVFHGTKKTQ